MKWTIITNRNGKEYYLKQVKRPDDDRPVLFVWTSDVRQALQFINEATAEHIISKNNIQQASPIRTVVAEPINVPKPLV